MTTHLPTLGVLVVLSVRAGAVQNPAPPTIEQLEAAARTDSNDAEVLYRLGVAYARAGRGADARRILLVAVHVDPQFALGYVALAQLHEVPGRTVIRMSDRPEVFVIEPSKTPTDSTRLFLRRAFQINPFIEIHAPGINELPVVWRGTLQLALRHYHDGKLTQALEEFGSVIQRSMRPNHPGEVPPVAVWYHILTAAQLRRYEDAVHDGELLLDASFHVPQQDATSPVARLTADIQYVLADLNRAAGHAAEAERLYRLVLEGDLSYYMAHGRLAEMYEAEGRWDDAVAERQRAINANPDDPSLLYDLGRTLVAAKRDPDAERTFAQAVQANPRETRAVYLLGVVRIRLGRFPDARAALSQFLDTAPSRYAEMITDAREQLAALPQ